MLLLQHKYVAHATYKKEHTKGVDTVAFRKRFGTRVRFGKVFCTLITLSEAMQGFPRAISTNQTELTKSDFGGGGLISGGSPIYQRA
jgi:hypothetical protein